MRNHKHRGRGVHSGRLRAVQQGGQEWVWMPVQTVNQECPLLPIYVAGGGEACGVTGLPLFLSARSRRVRVTGATRAARGCLCGALARGGAPSPVSTSTRTTSIIIRGGRGRGGGERPGPLRGGGGLGFGGSPSSCPCRRPLPPSGGCGAASRVRRRVGGAAGERRRSRGAPPHRREGRRAGGAACGWGRASARWR